NHAFESVYCEMTKFSNPTNQRLISPTTTKPMINSTHKSFKWLLSNPLIVNSNMAQNQSFSNHLFELGVNSNIVQNQIAFESVYYGMIKFSNSTNRRLISPTTEPNQGFSKLEIDSNIVQNQIFRCNSSIKLEFNPNMIQNQIFATNFDFNLPQNQNFRSNYTIGPEIDSNLEKIDQTIDSKDDISVVDYLLLYVGLKFTKWEDVDKFIELWKYNGFSFRRSRNNIHSNHLGVHCRSYKYLYSRAHKAKKAVPVYVTKQRERYSAAIACL
ncbi:23117_t:CDS:2, partial [Gigaspora rosea]